MRSNINNLLLGNPTSNFRKIAQNKHQTLENMEASQRPSRELYLTVQKTGNFANKEIMYEQDVIEYVYEPLPAPIKLEPPVNTSPPMVAQSSGNAFWNSNPVIANAALQNSKLLQIVLDNFKPLRPLTKIEKELLERAIKEGAIDEVIYITKEIQKETPPAPQIVGGTYVKPAPQIDGGTSVSLGPKLGGSDADKIEAQKTLDKLQKEKDLQKKVILYGGIATGVLWLITVVIGIILIRNS